MYVGDPPSSKKQTYRDQVSRADHAVINLYLLASLEMTVLTALYRPSLASNAFCPEEK